MAKARSILQQRICLRLDNFPDYLTKILYDEYQIGSSCDVVIKSGPEKQESFCHKIILAFSSDYLREILSTVTPGVMPVLLLPDIATDIIDYLMIFLYTGQVRIPTEKYAEFVEACKELHLKGMSWNEDEQEEIMDPVDPMEDTLLNTGIEEIPMDTTTEEQITEYIDYIEDEPETFRDETVSPIPKSTVKTIRKRRDDLRPPSPIKKRMKMILREPHQKIILNESNISLIREKLIAAILNVYKNMNMKLKDVQLVVKDDRLQKGLYQCSLCEKMISVVYTVDKNGKFRQWVNSNLKRHIQRTHPD